MKQYAPAAERNQQPILQVLTKIMPARGTVLEVASGTGQHAAFFASQLSPLQWLPTERDPEHLSSIAAWRLSSSDAGIFEPQILDVTEPDWTTNIAAEALPIVAVVSINMVHIAPWTATEGLFWGAGRLLEPNSLVFLYGPFIKDGHQTAPSNLEFHARLVARNPSWGVRELGQVSGVARAQGFVLDEVYDMPANNLSLVFRKVAA